MKRPGGAVVAMLQATQVDADVPRYLALYRRIRAMVLDGTLAPGARLPSTRTLARDLGVGRNTVETALEQLRAEGFLERRVGSGTFVASSLPLAAHSPRRPGRPTPRPPPRLSARAERAAVVAGAMGTTATRAFAPCAPSAEDFPIRIWNRLLSRAIRRGGAAILREVEPAGLPALRRAIAEHAAAARGIRCEWRQVIVFSSTQQALDLASRVLLEPGDAVWLEDPGYLGARAALEQAGARIVPVPVDAEGIVVSVGEELAPRARLAYVTPSHQYPLGVTLALGRRLALLGWARRAGAWIFEDDYDSEFRYVGRPLAAVQGLDDDDRVVYAGTFNKVLFPALRMAYLVVPPALVDPITAARVVADGAAPALEQSALADFVGGGHLAAHLRRIREVYRARRNRLLSVGAVLPVEFGPADTGMHVTAWLKRRESDARISLRAAELGLDTPPLSRYAIGPTRPGLLLHYGGMALAEIDDGVARLGRAFESSRK